MTAAGWHPDPHGRAHRRYHDGTAWTAHVSDAAGARALDPDGAGRRSDEPVAIADAPPPGMVIGPPPPRRSGPAEAPADEAEGVTEDPTVTIGPIVGPEPEPTTDAGLPDLPTGPVDPDEAARAAALEPESTTVLPGERPRGAGSADATQVTRVPGDLLHRGAPGGPKTPPGGSVAARPAPGVTGRAGASPAGIGLALAGVAIGLVSLLALPWAEGGGAEASFADLRRVVVAAGPDIGPAPTALLLTGAFSALALGGTIALARAVGLAAVRYLAVALVVLGAVGLSVVGLSSPGSVRAPGAEDATSTTVAGRPGTVIVDESGAAVTEPDTGAIATVPEPTPDQALRHDGPVETARDRLRRGALLGTGLTAVVALLGVVGLLVRGTAGHVLAAAGLAVSGLGAAVGVGGLATQGQLGGLGNGALGFVVATIALAVAAALPASSPRA